MKEVKVTIPSPTFGAKTN